VLAFPWGPVVFALPWISVLLVLLVWVRKPSELPSPSRPGGEKPYVSVIVPARNEAANIERCVRSLARSSYPSFEIIVVDDGSEDGTGVLARGIERGHAARLQVLDGEALPPGWLGKPWACWQAARVARGELLLFTDADTTHGPDLLARAVAGLEEERADLLTVVGTQIMETFWERLVQPHIFLVMFFRFPRFEQTAKSARWREAIANGQYMLFRRSAYDAIGGHEAVRDEVVEDLALAQHVKRSGLALRIRSAESDLATRMYRSLGHLVEGWSKNLAMGGMQSLPRRLRPLAPPLALVTGVGLWLLPPLALVSALAGFEGEAMLVWSATVCVLSAGIWVWFTHEMGAPAVYGLLYPLGAAVGTYIFLRSWLRGSRVEWKGRRYDLPSAAERP
jgi:chlorobactene glucosyltransferase